MKTPQEIAAELVLQWSGAEAGFLLEHSGYYAGLRRLIESAISAAREEAFRGVEVYLEGSANIEEEIGLRIETEGLLGDSKLCHSRARVLRQKAAHVRALASQSKPEPEPEKGKAP